MLYKPNYCCNCGEKIERIEWYPWTNRRFCEICETDHQLDDWLKRIFPTLFLLFGIFGIGTYFQSNTNSVDELKTLKNNSSKQIQPKQDVKSEVLENPELKQNLPSGNQQETIENQAADLAPPPKQEQNVELPEQQQPRIVTKRPQNNSSLPVYFCGAETKKGTPCSRRVKGGGRCWQHQGREAILTKEELKAER